MPTPKEPEVACYAEARGDQEDLCTPPFSRPGHSSELLYHCHRFCGAPACHRCLSLQDTKPACRPEALSLVAAKDEGSLAHIVRYYPRLSRQVFPVLRTSHQEPSRLPEHHEQAFMETMRTRMSTRQQHRQESLTGLGGTYNSTVDTVVEIEPNVQDCVEPVRKMSSDMEPLTHASSSTVLESKLARSTAFHPEVDSTNAYLRLATGAGLVQGEHATERSAGIYRSWPITNAATLSGKDGRFKTASKHSPLRLLLTTVSRLGASPGLTVGGKLKGQLF